MLLIALYLLLVSVSHCWTANRIGLGSFKVQTLRQNAELSTAPSIFSLPTTRTTMMFRALPSAPGDLFLIPVKTLKPSGLRLSLSLLCLGLQNTPVQKAWQAQQEDDGVTMYWNDGTAALQVTIGYLGLRFLRMGEEPSLPYQLNEVRAKDGRSKAKRSDGKVPSISLQKNPVASRFASRYRYVPPVYCIAP